MENKISNKTQEETNSSTGSEEALGLNSEDELIRSYQKSIPSLTLKDGLPFPGLLLTKRFHEIPDFKVREDDLLIAGYPRSGEWI